MPQGRKGTGPYGSYEQCRNLQQVTARIHKNDHVLFKQLLSKDGLKYQSFISAMVESYLRRDQELLKILNDWKEANHIRWKGLEKERFDFSDREKRSLLDELSKEFDDSDEG